MQEGRLAKKVFNVDKNKFYDNNQSSVYETE
jgi:hypothetical protein